MVRFFKRTDGMFSPWVYGGAAGVVFVLGKQWPAYETALWAAFLAACAAHLYVELRKPVNYTSMTVSDDAVEYVQAGRRHHFRLDEVAHLELVRERAFYGNWIESKWVVYTLADARIEILDEWPHRRRLLRVFARRLPGFDDAAARRGLRAWKEGVWPCFARI